MQLVHNSFDIFLGHVEDAKYNITQRAVIPVQE